MKTILFVAIVMVLGCGSDRAVESRAVVPVPTMAALAPCTTQVVFSEGQFKIYSCVNQATCTYELFRRGCCDEYFMTWNLYGTTNAQVATEISNVTYDYVIWYLEHYGPWHPPD